MLVFFLCHMIGMSSSCSNPALYGFLNNNFVKELKIICKGRKIRHIEVSNWQRTALCVHSGPRASKSYLLISIVSEWVFMYVWISIHIKLFRPLFRPKTCPSITILSQYLSVCHESSQTICLSLPSPQNISVQRYVCPSLPSHFRHTSVTIPSQYFSLCSKAIKTLVLQKPLTIQTCF